CLCIYADVPSLMSMSHYFVINLSVCTVWTLCFSVFFLFERLPPTSTLFPYTTLFRSERYLRRGAGQHVAALGTALAGPGTSAARDRKSTRLNSSHVKISYAVFCLKKKKTRPAFKLVPHMCPSEAGAKILLPEQIPSIH